MVRKMTLTVALTAVAGAAVPATASAAAPSVSTGGTTKVTSVSAHLTGKVNPRGQTTTYSFQYGTSTKYGASTAVASAGSGTKTVDAGADIGGLQGNVTYHYRIVASSPGGVVSGSDRTFRTAKVPLSLTLAATPNPTPFGGATTLSGVLAGTDGGGKTVKLQQKGFPYTAPDFEDVPGVSPVVTAGNGAFAFTVAGLQQNVQYRAVTTTGRTVVSAPVLVGVAPTVRTAVSTRHPRRGRMVRFAGTVTPAFEPAQVAIQRRRANNVWVTVGGVYTKSAGPNRSRYAKSIKVRTAGTYRVFVGLPNAKFAPAVGPNIRITPRSK